MKKEVPMIQPKYSIGQSVIGVHVSWLETKVQCPDCLGQKEWTVSLPSGEVFQHDCQTCRQGWFSTGIVSDWGDKARFQNLTIGSVRIDTAADKPVSYMCIETGIGSGTVHYEETLFATKEEAERYAEMELERVRGLRHAEELKQRAHRKRDSLIHGKRKKA